MTDAPIDPERLGIIAMLLSLLSDRPDPGAAPPLTADEVPGDPSAVATAIETHRLLHHVEELATTPRHWAQDHAAAARAAEYAAEQFADAGLSVERVPVTFDSVDLPAVYAEVPGVSAAESPRHGARRGHRPTVVLVAHYDTVPDSPGADDNASGVAAVLEAARVLPRGVLPAAVVLAVVPFEEAGGLAGSVALADHLSGHPGRELVAAISAEMVGYAAQEPRIPGDDGRDLLLLGYPGTEELVAVLAAAAGYFSTGRVRGLAVPREVPDLGRSDHASFHAIGVPAVMATDGAEYRNVNYHRPSDTPDTIDPDFLTGSARSLTVGVMAAAARFGGSPS